MRISGLARFTFRATWNLSAESNCELHDYLIPHLNLSELAHHQSRLVLHFAKISSACRAHDRQRIPTFCIL